MLTGSPRIGSCPRVRSPTKTSPVLTPVRVSIVNPHVRASSALSSSRASRISAAGAHGAQRVVLVDLRDAEHAPSPRRR